MSIDIFFFFIFIGIFFFPSRLNFEFVLNRGKPTETKYTFATREPLHGPIEYHKSFLKVSLISPRLMIHSFVIFSTKMIMSYGLFINLNLGRFNLPSAFYQMCVGGVLFSLSLPLYHTYTCVEVFNLL